MTKLPIGLVRGLASGQIRMSPEATISFGKEKAEEKRKREKRRAQGKRAKQARRKNRR